MGSALVLAQPGGVMAAPQNLNAQNRDVPAGERPCDGRSLHQ